MKVCTKCGKDESTTSFYSSSSKCKPCYIEDQTRYNNNHKEERLKYLAERRKNNKHHKILDSHRALLWRCVKNKCICGSDTLERQIGCSVASLRHHLEDLFKDGMNWNNYGMDGWVVDHKKPCSSFDLRFKKNQEICFNYSNLQPLWFKENQEKAASES